MRCRGKVLLTLLMLGFAFTSLVPVANTQPLHMISPSPGIYVHLGLQEAMNVENSAEIANIGFIVGDESVMVIDPGANPRQGKRLLDAVRLVTDLPISYVVLTHFHPDHVFGAKSFSQTGEFVAHRRYPAAMAQRANFYRQNFSYLNVGDEGDLVVPELLVSESLSVDLGNRPIKLIAFPTAHTDNDLAVLDSRTDTLWASDLLFVDRVPSLDGSALGWLAAIEGILADEGVQRIIPGHGKPGTTEEVVPAQRQYLKKLISETRTAVRQNVGLADATTSVAHDEKSNWLLFDAQHKGNVTKAYTELEWE